MYKDTDDVLRRKVLATFPPISVSGNSRLRRAESMESLSLYSKSKASNSWSSSSSQSTQPLMKIRKRTTHNLINPRYSRALAEESPLLTRSHTTIGLNTMGKDTVLQPAKRAAIKTTNEGSIVQPTRERKTSKEGRESSTTASSSLPKVQEEQTSMPIARPRKGIQRELTLIIKYEGGECVQETFNGRRASLTLPKEDENASEIVGFLAPAKNQSILQWLEKCHFTGFDDVDHDSVDTHDHLPALVTKETDITT
ncbi:uncharacterized protein LOC100368570 [Saccoglossus kowalevskii]|uniref:Uncharacterized protein LOC100368570 n=1 Tax=Saccoglossus kowalevskii TaxID=10224 RepID=A0ABM0GNL9_SACKO|nr:PREDICTED: uncharacterized protein LOC100368570 [Saccoglossus kowalevskii]